MANEQSCPLCGQSNVPFGMFDYERDWRQGSGSYDCPRCGRYGISDTAASVLGEKESERFRVSAVTRESHVRGRAILVVADGEQSWAVSGFEVVTLSEVVESRFPRGPDEIANRALLNLSRMSAHYGFRLHTSLESARPLLFARNDDEMVFVTEMLKAAGYLKEDGAMGIWGGTLTPSGWNRVAELTSARVGEGLTQAFIAMWFGSDKDEFGGRKSAEFCTDAFLSGFKPGIEAAGYSALRIDLKEFNDDIVDHVIAEIRRSRFVVADFTGQRSGVYYEAGFALGLGLTVIFTCHKSHLKDAHFDTNHMKHIAWETPEELACKLERRIAATIGRGPLKSVRADT